MMRNGRDGRRWQRGGRQVHRWVGAIASVVLVVLGPWMLRTLVDWSAELFSQLAQWGAL